MFRGDRSIARLVFTAAAMSGVLLAAGCAAPARTTRLQTQDFVDIAVEIAASLRESDFLRERTADSSPMTIALNKVENLTTDILSDGEKWYLMDRVIDSDSIRALGRERAIRFVIPVEKLRSLQRTVGEDEVIAAQRSPTHTMTAVIRSVTRAASLNRTELYSAFYTITDLSDGATAWSGDFELKREAFGRSYN